jgi:diguanylate cyclase (GGDEF)-like protein/PAS domain S-box-containing protein
VSSSPERLQRRLERERRARREAEEIAERATRELYEVIRELQRTTAVVDETTDFVAITDPGGRARYVNRAVRELLGLTDEGDVAVNMFDLLSEASREHLLQDALPALEEKGVWRGELVIVKPASRAEIPVSQVLIAHRDHSGKLESISSISRDITDRLAREEQLTQLALHDQLTGLPNRRLFFDRLDVALARAERLAVPIGLFFLDLDHFKPINDDLGHEAGDEVLVTIAQRLRSCMRPSDTAARLGGDEFAVLCEHVTDEAGARLVAERITGAIARPMSVGTTEVSVTASVGVVVAAAAPEGGLEVLLRAADAAMYQAKREGRGRYRISS